MDNGDYSQRAADQYLKADLAARRKAPCGPSVAICADCGCEIPAERREAAPGCTRCIFCQIRFERKV